MKLMMIRYFSKNPKINLGKKSLLKAYIRVNYIKSFTSALLVLFMDLVNLILVSCGAYSSLDANKQPTTTLQTFIELSLYILFRVFQLFILLKVCLAVRNQVKEKKEEYEYLENELSLNDKFKR